VERLADGVVIRQLYSLGMWAAQPLLRRKLRKRALVEPGYGVAVEERFGHYVTQAANSKAATQGGASVGTVTVWLHAVSLGETRAAAVLVERLRAAIPGMRLLLTHGTATGREAGKALLRDGDVQVWQPWDTPAAVARFLARFQPRIGLLMETEVWPNMVALCAQRALPLCLVNARLSDKSLRQSLRLAWLARPAFAALRAVWAQTEDDAARLRQLGASVQAVNGNLKFDASPNAAQVAQGRAWRAASDQPVVMFASSREGEEALWIAALQRLAASAASKPAQWLIVPRHPQRFDEVAALLGDAGLAVSRRTTWGDGPGATPSGSTVWLGDSLGEMALYFGMADVALLGGSFAKLGGQNLIEAAACECPIVMGSHTFNFAEAAQMAREAGAALEVADLSQAIDTALALVHSPARLQQTRAAALQWAQSHRGAADRTVRAVLELL
jgi:3-deoxy-D-manno-octulosonic-acid transferase